MGHRACLRGSTDPALPNQFRPHGPDLVRSIGSLLGDLDLLDASPAAPAIGYANLVIACLGVYALRGHYFALLEQTRVRHAVTGAPVGLISLIGDTPDILVGPIAGRLLDNYPGVTAATISRGVSRRGPAAVTPS